MGSRKATEKEREKEVKIWLDNSDNQPEVYKDAVKLKKIIQDVIDEAKTQGQAIQPETLNAATRLMSQLDVAIEQWKKRISNDLDVTVKEGVFSSKIEVSSLKQIKELTERALSVECCAAVNNNKNLLMKDPSFWEQVKESINNSPYALTLA